jgi:hypothetical protein
MAMANHGARRRAERAAATRQRRAEADAARRSPSSSEGLPPGLTGVFMAGSGAMVNVHVHGFDTGLVVAEDAKVRGRGLRFADNRVGIDNGGQFHGPDTEIS